MRRALVLTATTTACAVALVAVMRSPRLTMIAHKEWKATR